MDTSDLSKLRRLALGVAAVLITILLASVEIETPARIAPLGIPLVIKRPDLLTVGLVLVSLYSTLRYVYYGFFVRPSPMRLRRVLRTGRLMQLPLNLAEVDNYIENIGKEIYKNFPQFGNKKVSYIATGGKIKQVTVEVPLVIDVLCWVEAVDYSLPIIANIAALTLWGYFATCGS